MDMNDKLIEKQINQRLKREHSQEKPTFREKISDSVAEFGGSWVFIITFSLFFLVWIAFNIFIYQFDSYPFILLNLILSCLSVFQAPFILMSQNRMREIDRKRDERAYKTNLKTELEIKEFETKLNHLIYIVENYMDKK